MKPNKRFVNQPKSFWASVRTISQKVGYTQRNKGQIKIPTFLEMKSALQNIGLDPAHIITRRDELTKIGRMLGEYFQYRASVLNDFVEPRLMDTNRAREVFEKLHANLLPKCPIPMNKQNRN